MENFTDWINEQARLVESELRRHAARGDCWRMAVYFTPAKPGKWARLSVAESCPIGATQTLFFRMADIGITSKIGSIPYADIAAHLRAACRDLPVYPIAHLVGQSIYIIHDGRGLFWSNVDGWANRENATEYTKEEHEQLRLPIGGRWAETQKPLVGQSL